MPKKYINSWRPYEQPYIQAMAMAGVSRDEAEERLCAVNQRLKAPVRGWPTIRKMGQGMFVGNARLQQKERAIKRYEAIALYMTKNKATMKVAALDFNCSLTTVKKAMMYACIDNEHSRAWAEWELVYCVGLHDREIAYSEIHERMMRISKQIGSPVRSLSAVMNRIQKAKRLQRANKT